MKFLRIRGTEFKIKKNNKKTKMNCVDCNQKKDCTINKTLQCIKEKNRRVKKCHVRKVVSESN